MKAYFKELKSSIQNYRTTPFKNTAYILSFVVLIISMTTFIIAFCKFVQEGGFDGDQYFSIGTVPFYYSICKYSSIGFVTAIAACLIGFSKKEEKAARKDVFCVGVISYIILPAILLLASNLIGIIGIVMIVGFLSVMIFGVGSTSANGDHGRENERRPHETPELRKEKAKQTTGKTITFYGNCRFYRGKGGMEILQPQADAIYMDGNFQTRVYVCTVEEFEQGKVEIYLNGKRVTCI